MARGLIRCGPVGRRQFRHYQSILVEASYGETTKVNYPTIVYLNDHFSPAIKFGNRNNACLKQLEYLLLVRVHLLLGSRTRQRTGVRWFALMVITMWSLICRRVSMETRTCSGMRSIELQRELIRVQSRLYLEVLIHILNRGWRWMQRLNGQRGCLA